MARRAYELVRRDDRDEPSDAGPHNAAGIRATLDELATARCPLCRAMLVARMSRAGPRFFCLCPAKERKKAA